MEKVMSLIIREFDSYDMLELHLVLFGRSREIIQPIPDSVNVHKPNWKFKNERRSWHTVKTIFFLRKKIKAISPDTLLSFGEMWNNLVLLSTVGLATPIFVSDRSKPDKNLGLIQNALRDYLYPRAAGFIAQTEKAAQVAKEQSWNRNIAVIGNPVSLIELGSHEENEVLTVGRLIATKNIDRLMEMFQEVNQNGKWKLIVVGGNAKKKNLLEQYSGTIEKKGWKEHIQLLGEKNEVTSFYQRAKIFAFTSTSEGFPNALAEAMAAGCACIAYDCVAGPSDIIDDGVNGFLIQVGDEVEYKKKLQLLMEDEGLRKHFGKVAREKMKQFEAGKIARRFYEFITEPSE